MQHQEKVGKSIPRLLERNKNAYTKHSVIRPSDNYTFYGITKTRSGDPEISLALKIIKADGSQLIIQYHEMISPMRYNGIDEIEIATSSLSITIKGKNLDDIIDYLAEHRLVWIKEPDSDFTIVEEKEEVQVEGIVVEKMP